MQNVADFFSQVKASTAGERLYQRLLAHGMKDLRSSRLGEQKFVRLTGRGAPFGTYLEGSTIAFAFKRIMKASHGIFRDKTVDRAICNLRLSATLREWYGWLDKDDLGALVRDALRAHDASDKPITKSIETEIWHKRRIHKCCFCGTALTASSDSIVRDVQGKKATLEHVWPSSLGGDSVPDNLVPACADCNRVKSDLVTWEQGSVHEFIYPINFHLSDYFPRLPLAHKILLQRRAVVMLAQRDKISLKQALLRVGPYGEIKPLNADDTWDIFNTQNHLDSLGEFLW